MRVNNVCEEIKRFIVGHFAVARNRNINNDDPLLENGILDSLAIVELIAYLEDEFKISVLDDDLIPENFQTIQKLSNFVQRKSSSTANTLDDDVTRVE